MSATSTRRRVIPVWRGPGSGRIRGGLILSLVIVVVAAFGPLLAPFGETQIVGRPFSADGSLLGTDYLGHDVVSRMLYGGRSILVISLLATGLALVLGAAIGILAAYAGGVADEVVMRLNDVFLAFPQILLALLVLSAVDRPTWWLIVFIVGVSHAPRVARVVRGMALRVVTSDYIASADALGEARTRIVVREMLPNMAGPLLAEAGLRLTYSIGMVAGIGFLGFSADPSAADWGQMINENRLALLVQPAGVLAPVIVIGLFTLGTNLIADGLTERFGTGETR